MSPDPSPALRPRYPIATPRLLLRPLTAGDVDALLAYRSQPQVCRYVPFEPMTREVVNRRLAEQWANTELTDEGQALTLGVELAATGQLIGDVVLFWHSRQHGGGELGYVLHPDFGGHGYATEAARAGLALGFDELGLHRITARIDERNTASASVARRLGMRLEARLVHSELFKGEWSTELDFAMLADEWRTSAAAPDDHRTEALRAAERALQRAQLASDVAVLDRLLDERLIFTGPDGNHYTKQDDLRVHRTGEQTLTEVEQQELTVLVVGRTGVTWFLGTLAGTMGGTAFTARVRYTRTWIYEDGYGWRLLAAHVGAA